MIVSAWTDELGLTSLYRTNTTNHTHASEKNSTKNSSDHRSDGEENSISTPNTPTTESPIDPAVDVHDMLRDLYSRLDHLFDTVHELRHELTILQRANRMAYNQAYERDQNDREDMGSLFLGFHHGARRE